MTGVQIDFQTIKCIDPLREKTRKENKQDVKPQVSFHKKGTCFRHLDVRIKLVNKDSKRLHLAENSYLCHLLACLTEHFKLGVAFCSSNFFLFLFFFLNLVIFCLCVILLVHNGIEGK